MTLVLAHTTFSIPYVIFNVRARLSGYDNSIEEASMDLGANRIKTFFNITLPVLAPGIGGGALLAFTLSIDVCNHQLFYKWADQDLSIKGYGKYKKRCST